MTGPGVEERAPAKRICIFNHKGGVGKTTLTMNVGAVLAEQGNNVLLVDTDPQCNLTSYLVDAEVVDDLLDNSDGPSGQTIWSAVKPISEAMGGVNIVKPIQPGISRLSLVAGDIRLSEFEVDLNEFWGQCLQRKARGFRGTTAISQLVNELCHIQGVDYVLYDSGPNIGPLNRVVLLDCDYFIVPVACDLFSLRALRTLGRTLSGWISSWQTIADLAPTGTPLLPGKPAFLGYIPEGFRIYAGSVITAQQNYLSRIDREVKTQVISILTDLDPELVVTRRGTYRLGELKNFGALVTESQTSGVPLHRVSAAPYQRSDARTALNRIVQSIEKLTS